MSSTDAIGATLYVAATKGDTETVRQIIHQYCQSARPEILDFADEDGLTPLMRASLVGHHQIVDLLCEAKASVDAVNKDGYTALMLASAEGHVQIVKILLSRGADVNIQDKDGSTALLWSCRSDAFSAQMILAAGANSNIANTNGLTPLMAAVCNNQHETVRQLILSKADVNAIHQDGSTALLGAIEEGNLSVMQMLLLAGARLFEEGAERGFTFGFDVESGKEELVTLLNSFLTRTVDHKKENLALVGVGKPEQNGRVDSNSLRTVIEEYLHCQHEIELLKTQLSDAQENSSQIQIMASKIRNLQIDRDHLYEELSTLKEELSYADEESLFMSKELENAKVLVEELRSRTGRGTSKRLNSARVRGESSVVSGETIFSGIFCTGV
jgi:ankyrin repeat protein